MPIEGYDLRERIVAFGQIADMLVHHGYTPINPLSNGLSSEAPHEAHIRDGLKTLLNCDYIVRPYNAYKSERCKIEAKVAKKCGIPLLGFIADTLIIEWMRRG